MEIPAALGRGLDPYVRGDAGGIPGGRHGVTGFSTGWPVAMLPLAPRGPGEAQDSDMAGRIAGEAWPLHCYGMVGVGRNVSPDTGSGAELYVVIGQAPRQLDRNIALVGRVIEGIEYLSSLPRGTGELGFYRTAAERTPILSVRMGSEVAGLPTYEYLFTGSDSFAAFADKRANRKDEFYIRPAGGVDVCNVPVPIRVAKR
jgi:peptidylprolyl isomerase